MPRANRYSCLGTSGTLARPQTTARRMTIDHIHSECRFSFAAVEAQVNAIAAAILREPRVQRLVYIANEVHDKPQRSGLLVGW